MKLSTGKVAFPIEFDNGDIQTIYFNPNDPNLFIRMSELQERVSERINDIKDMELNADGKPQNNEALEQFERIQNIVFDELDYAFGSKISDIVFKYCSPFAVTGGQYFIIQFMEAMLPELEKEIKKSNKQVNEHMRKYIDKYKK